MFIQSATPKKSISTGNILTDAQFTLLCPHGNETLEVCTGCPKGRARALPPQLKMDDGKAYPVTLRCVLDQSSIKEWYSGDLDVEKFPYKEGDTSQVALSNNCPHCQEYFVSSAALFVKEIADAIHDACDVPREISDLITELARCESCDFWYTEDHDVEKVDFMPKLG